MREAAESNIYWSNGSNYLNYILQKMIVRTITFADKLAHTNPIFKDIEVLPLAKLVHCRIGLFMYKIFYKLQPTVINKMYGQMLIYTLIT